MISYKKKSNVNTTALSLFFDVLPVVSNFKAAGDVIRGKDLVTDKKLSSVDRLLAGVSIAGSGYVKVAGKAEKVEKVIKKKMYGMNINEKITFIRETAAPIAKQNGWKKDSKLSTINKRDVYYDSKSKTYYALDTQHGRFEVQNKRGKHQGEVDFNLSPTKKADKSGGHDLRMK
ncbi:pre-toxin TG domain-containing protein [Bacillus mexicanus]|uniref:pre-toxin TG domain-containing protein n=1 Tax=Bacillus mexicanus TaxID=2834415 RepID=UPI003D241798